MRSLPSCDYLAILFPKVNSVLRCGMCQGVVDYNIDSFGVRSVSTCARCPRCTVTVGGKLIQTDEGCEGKVHITCSKGRDETLVSSKDPNYYNVCHRVFY